MSTNNHILIEFEMLYDVDLAILKVVKEKYNNPEYINNTILGIGEEFLIGELIKRKDANPLSIVIHDKYMDTVDSLYNDILKEEESSILDLVKRTSLLDLMNVYLSTSLVKVDVICKNKQEEQIIKEVDNRFTVVNSKLSEVDISQYDSIFIKEYKNVVQIPKLTFKNIFIGRYGFNLEDDNMTPLLNISTIVSSHNAVNIIDVYEEVKYITVSG